MMTPVWKCARCEQGPCYFQCAKANPRTLFDDDDGSPPFYCPYSGEHVPEFEYCAPEITFRMRYMEEMQEWLMGPGYENVPEEIRDALAVDLQGRIDGWRAMQITQVLRNYEETGIVGIAEQEDWDKAMKKISKGELLNAIMPEAFKAGLIYGEMIRQRREKKGSEAENE